MEKIKLQPLSDFEKRQAEENHGLVYSFLHRHGYSIEKFYNICIFGFLKGIQVYNRRADLQEKYKLAFICERYMQAELGNHFRMENYQKRKPAEAIISLDADYAEMENLYNRIIGKSLEDEFMETELLMELLKNLSEIQRKITKMKLEGYGNKEIYILLDIKPSVYYKELQQIKAILENCLMMERI